MKLKHLKVMVLCALLAGSAVVSAPAHAQEQPAAAEPAQQKPTYESLKALAEKRLGRPLTTSEEGELKTGYEAKFGPITPAAPAGDGTAAPAPAAPAPMESRVKPMAPKPPVQRRITAPVIAAGIISGVSLISGGIFAVLAASDHSSYKDKPDNDVALSGESNSLKADTSFGIGILFGLTAIALYFLPDEPPPSASASTTPTPRRPATSSSWLKSALKGELQF